MANVGRATVCESECLACRPVAGNCPHGIPRNDVSVGCLACPCPQLHRMSPHIWEDDWCRYCGVTRTTTDGGICEQEK